MNTHMFDRFDSTKLYDIWRDIWTRSYYSYNLTHSIIICNNKYIKQIYTPYLKTFFPDCLLNTICEYLVRKPIRFELNNLTTLWTPLKQMQHNCMKYTNRKYRLIVSNGDNIYDVRPPSPKPSHNKHLQNRQPYINKKLSNQTVTHYQYCGLEFKVILVPRITYLFNPEINDEIEYRNYNESFCIQLNKFVNKIDDNELIHYETNTFSTIKYYIIPINNTGAVQLVLKEIKKYSKNEKIYQRINLANPNNFLFLSIDTNSNVIFVFDFDKDTVYNIEDKTRAIWNLHIELTRLYKPSDIVVDIPLYKLIFPYPEAVNDCINVPFNFVELVRDRKTKANDLYLISDNMYGFTSFLNKENLSNINALERELSSSYHVGKYYTSDVVKDIINEITKTEHEKYIGLKIDPNGIVYMVCFNDGSLEQFAVRVNELRLLYTEYLYRQ